jgi:bleomycin hydrolase
MKKKILLFLSIAALNIHFCGAQVRDTGVFVEQSAGYYQNSILKGIGEFEHPAIPKPVRKYLAMDMSKKKLPNELSKYTSYWRQAPISQGNTGTCWAFASSSMMESEIYRITGNSVKLSEMYLVYWDYVERAADFVRTRGETYFAEGSEANAWMRITEKYGCVPYESYSGLAGGRKIYDHEAMISAVVGYLEKVKLKAAWNEEIVKENVKSILDSYMGTPPSEFVYKSIKYDPAGFCKDYCKLEPRDYYSFMSTLSQTYNQKGELVEADNWWHSRDYYNVHLTDFMNLIISAIRGGYSLCICGDVSEPGFDRYTQCGIIPTFDIPSAYIDESAREFRLANSSTTDDHCMHLIGYQEVDGQYWFLLKDSSAGAYDGKYKGYRFVSSDYIRLKMMNVMVHKDGARVVLDNIIK